ncbi:MAG: LPS export ABC transporter periplasmic protein LptC [Bacillota bacterium]
MDKKSIFLALFIFIIIAFAFYFSFEEIPTMPQRPQKTTEEKPAAELKEVNFYIYNEAEKQKLKLISAEVENFANDQRLELEPVEVEVYDLETEKLLYTLDGKEGTYYPQREYLEVRGQVVVESDLYYIFADELDYRMQKDYLEGRGNVRLAGTDFISTAEFFSSNLKLEQLNLDKKDKKEQAVINFQDLQQDLKAEESNDE